MTTIRYHTHSIISLLIQSIYPNVQRKKHVMTFLTQVSSISFSVRQSSLFVMKIVFQSWQTPAKNHLTWNAFRAADWRHHLISSTRIRYPNNPEERYQNHPIRRTSSEWPVIKWETVIMSPNSSTSELGFYHLVFVMKMICVLECSNIVDGWL